jgi:GNAT superfamily N-acetyltransferase
VTPAGIRIREAGPGDGPAIARAHRENAAYYSGLAPDLFRVPDGEGLVEFVEPTPADNSETTLLIVAELDGEVVGHLFAELLTPGETDRYQSSAELSEVRLFIQALSVLKSHWRRGVATALVEAAEAWGRDRGATVALCDTWPDSPVSMPFWTSRMGYAARSVRLRKLLGQPRPALGQDSRTLPP